jgi:hypothetical protein
MGQTEGERIAKLEANVDQFVPVIQQVNDLKVQLTALQGKLDSVETKLNVTLGILIALALPILGEFVRRISDRLSAPPLMSMPVRGDSYTMGRFETGLKKIEPPVDTEDVPDAPPPPTKTKPTSA